MSKDEKILHEMFRKAFDASTPKGNWDELLTNATKNENGQKVIPFDDYECESSVLEKIFMDTLKKYKVPKSKHSAFSFSFYLGPSPRTKI